MTKIPRVDKTGSSIAAVERETGLGKDTLRVWERRYGFPQPQRDPFGERIYPPDQLNRLKLIKRLMDQGLRPGMLMAEDDAALLRRVSALAAVGSVQRLNDRVTSDWIVPLLDQLDVRALRAEFSRRLAEQGIRRFVLETAQPLNQRVGDDWAAGTIHISAEHMYAELMQSQLRAAIHELPRPVVTPRVLLATLRGEEHLIGLLMVEALLLLEGAACMSLGARPTMEDDEVAAKRMRADIIALSFAGAYPWTRAKEALVALRAAVSAQTEIWVGGSGVARGFVDKLAGVQFFNHINQVPPAVTEWRVRAAEGAQARTRVG